MAVKETNSLLAVRNADRISVMKRVARSDSGEFGYVCVCRVTDDGSMVMFDKDTKEGAVKKATGRLEALEQVPGTLDPLRAPILTDLVETGEPEALARVLELCYYADFMRYAVARRAEIGAILSSDHVTPFDFRPLRPAFETLLDLDWPELARDYITGAIPVLEKLLTKNATKSDVFVGNAGYVLRIMADLSERLGDLGIAARALELSHLVAPNQKKLARLVFLYEKSEDHAQLQNSLSAYQQKFGLTDRMKVIKAVSKAKAG